LRKYLLLAFALLVRGHGYSQNSIFYDAQELSKCMDKERKFNMSENSKYSALPVLKRYYYPVDSADQFIKNLRSNPYFRDFSGNSNLKGILREKVESHFSSSKSINFHRAENSIPNLMAFRFKEDVTMNFFLKMKNDFVKYPELKALFPNTCEVLEYIDPLNLYYLFPVFRNAIVKDFDNFSINLAHLRFQSKYYNVFQTSKGKQFIASSIISSGLERGLPLDEIFASLLAEKFVQNDSSNVFQAVKYLGLISQTIRDTASNKIWVSHHQFHNFLESETRQKLLLGLLYQENSHYNIAFKSQFKDVFNLKNALKGADKNASDHWMDYFREVHAKALAYETRFDSLKWKTKAKEPLNNSDVDSYLSSVSSYMEAVLNIGTISESVWLANDIKESMLCNQKNFIILKNNISGQLGTTIFNTLQLLDSTIFSDKQNLDSRDVILKYGIFFANLAEAENPEAVKMAFESVIQPVRATATKSFSRWSLSLNAFLGLSGGLEFQSNPNHRAGVIGFSAPFGIGLYHNNNLFRNYIGCTGLYLNIVDFGILTRYQTTHNVSNRLPEFSLQNIIAPGVALQAGRILNSPFVLQTGIEYGPYNRIADVNNNPQHVSAWEWTVSLSYDIPVFYLWNRNR
jgi:hypothetical protein